MSDIDPSVKSYPVFKRINAFWVRLIGDVSMFSLEDRIFHSISIALIMLAVVYIPYNIFAGLYVAAVSCLFIGAFFSYQYYHSRFYGKPHNNTVFGLIGVVVFAVNYFANSGIDGSTDIIWPAYLLLIFAISPYRQHFTWLCVYVCCFLVLHGVEYYYPGLTKHPFVAGKGQFIDRVTAFPLPVITIYVVIKYIRKSYDKERIATEEKNRAIEIRNEQISQQKDELEQSNAEKNKLMSIISHDLRAPLTNIQSYLQMLNEDVLESHEKPLLEKDLLTATNNTMEMLSNLLYWSRSQMEGAKVNLVTANLFLTLKNTLDVEKMLAKKKGIYLKYHIDEQIAVTADIDMLQLVVRNLINNAIKFTPAGGSITVDARVMNKECKIMVNDNGKGIDEAKRQKLFSVTTDPSYGTNNEKGVGLGLLLCKEFIERQGGRIGFESTFGHGSSFFVFIPAKLAAEVLVPMV